MKHRTFIKELTLLTTLVVAAAFQAVAQPGPGGGGGFGVLTEEQRTKLRDTMQASQSEMAPLTEKLAAAQKEAIKAALADKTDDKALRAKVEAVAKIQTDIAMIRAKNLKDLKLTDEQKAQFEERPGMAYMMLFGGGFGGGRRGGGGFGGGAGGGANKQ